MANNTCFTRVCIDCGRVMHNVGYGRKRCPACAREAKQSASAAYNEAHKKEWRAIPKPLDPPTPETIREHAAARAAASDAAIHKVVCAASAAGVSYGMMAARMEGRL